MFPFVGGAGILVMHVSDSATEESTQLLEGEVPIVSTMVDAAGNPIAWLYEQRRWVVPSNRIANTMKLAIVSIEDKRFSRAQRRRLAGHPDRPGRATCRATATPAAGRRSSSSTSRTSTCWSRPRPMRNGAPRSRSRPARKLREIRMALALDAALPKAEILARYLNLVSFGNGAFGVQDAARTYFGINAARPQLAAGGAAGRDGALHQLAGPVHQPRGRAGAAQPRARHHDRQPAGQGRRTPRRQGPAAGRAAAARSAAAGLHRRR